MESGKWRDRAILRSRRAGIEWRARAGDIVPVVDPNNAADFDASVAAGNVIVALSVERTDFDVLDRVCLEGQIGGMRHRDCGQTGG